MLLPGLGEQGDESASIPDAAVWEKGTDTPTVKTMKMLSKNVFTDKNLGIPDTTMVVTLASA